MLVTPSACRDQDRDPTVLRAPSFRARLRTVLTASLVAGLALAAPAGLTSPVAAAAPATAGTPVETPVLPTPGADTRDQVTGDVGVSATRAVQGPRRGVAAGSGVTTTAQRTVALRALPWVARFAIQAVNSGTVDYVWGGGHGVNPPTSPDNTDCSGFSRWAIWTALGYDIGGDSSQGMRTSGQFQLVTGEPQPGDVVFFGENKVGRTYHMAIYIGRDMTGARLIAENSGTKTGARISSLEVPWRQQDLQGIYRLTAIKMSGLAVRTWITGVTTAPAPAGKPATISGRLLADAGPVAGQYVYLDEFNPRGDPGTPITRAKVLTRSDGTFTFTLGSNGVLRKFQVHYTGSWQPYLSSRTGAFYLTGA